MPVGRDAAAIVAARTRVDNSALARGMNDADRIMQQGTRQMQQSARSAGAGLGSAMGEAMMGALGSYIGLRGAIQMGHMAIELGQVGAQAERMEQSFRSLAGSGATRMLEELRETSRGTIDDMNLMTAANRAMMLGVTQDTETMTRLMEIAMVRGRAMGLSTQQAFSDLVTGLGRASPMILDNLGIVTGGERTFSEYAATLGKTADELSEVEKRQALLNKVMEESSGVAVPDAMEAFERYAAQRERLRTAFGQGLGAEGGLASGAAEVGASLLGGLAGYFEGAQRAREVTVAFEQALDDAREAGELTTAQWENMRIATWFAASGAELLGGRTTELYEVLRFLHPEIAANIAALYGWGNAAANAEKGLKGARLEAQRLESALKSALTGQASAMYRSLQDPRIARAVGAGRDPTRKTLDPDREWLAEPEKALRGGGGGISDAQRLAEQRAREFESLVQSVLQPTQVTGADVSATEHGAYVDKWDEYIRRLRADQSIPYYQRMETERQFYSGQMLDQVNWDAVIQDIARKQQEEAGRQNLLNEAMRRAQEAGLGANYADVAASLGIRDDTVTGAEAAQSFAEGAKSVDVAAGVVEQFVEGVRAQRQAMVDAGAESMRAFLEGSDQAITPDAGKKFARRIVPFVYDEFKAQGML